MFTFLPGYPLPKNLVAAVGSFWPNFREHLQTSFSKISIFFSIWKVLNFNVILFLHFYLVIHSPKNLVAAVGSVWPECQRMFTMYLASALLATVQSFQFYVYFISTFLQIGFLFQCNLYDHNWFDYSVYNRGRYLSWQVKTLIYPI